MYYHDAQGKRRQVSKTAMAKKKRDAVKELRDWGAQTKRGVAARPMGHGKIQQSKK